MAFEHLTDAKYCLLTTYRRTGDNVGTPVWFVRDGDSILVCTDDPSGKIRRMRRDPRVDVAACSWRGRRLGPDEPGRAVILSGPLADRARATMDSNYSLGKRLFYRFIHPLVSRRKAMVFVRIDADFGAPR